MSKDTETTKPEMPSERNGGEQYLTFIVDDEEYGVDILRVQGIQGWSGATPIPGTPEHVLGVINLRGSVVPIVDLRSRFGLPTLAFSKTTVVIVLRVDGEDKERIVGVVVDAVSEVYNVSDNDIQSMPEVGSAIDTKYVRGLATLDNEMVILLDVDQLLSIDLTVVTDEAGSVDSEIGDAQSSQAA